jgi:hypothetical protein
MHAPFQLSACQVVTLLRPIRSYMAKFGATYDASEEIYVVQFDRQTKKVATNSLAMAGWRVPHRLTQTDIGWYQCSRHDSLAQIAAKHGSVLFVFLVICSFFVLTGEEVKPYDHIFQGLYRSS